MREILYLYLIQATISDQNPGWEHLKREMNAFQGWNLLLFIFLKLFSLMLRILHISGITSKFLRRTPPISKINSLIDIYPAT